MVLLYNPPVRFSKGGGFTASISEPGARPQPRGEERAFQEQRAEGNSLYSEKICDEEYRTKRSTEVLSLSLGGSLPLGGHRSIEDRRRVKPFLATPIPLVED